MDGDLREEGLRWPQTAFEEIWRGNARRPKGQGPQKDFRPASRNQRGSGFGIVSGYAVIQELSFPSSSTLE
jgi:hypothetical protein